MIAFPALAIGSRQHGGLASKMRDSLQAGSRCEGGEDDGPLRTPRGTARLSVGGRNSHCRAARDGDSLHRWSREEPDPLSVRRSEDAAWGTETARPAKSRQNGRLELVQPAHEQLIAAAIHDP